VGTVKAEKKQRGGRLFQKGQSGNPAGKPRGAKNKATIAAETLLDGEAQALTRKAIELALGGDSMALRLCLERIIPPRKDRPVILKTIPPVKTGSDATKFMARVLESVSNGELTPSEGEAIGQVLGLFCKSLETRDFEERLQRLEGMLRDDPGAAATEG